MKQTLCPEIRFLILLEKANSGRQEIPQKRIRGV